MIYKSPVALASGVTLTAPKAFVFSRAFFSLYANLTDSARRNSGQIPSSKYSLSFSRPGSKTGIITSSLGISTANGLPGLLPKRAALLKSDESWGPTFIPLELFPVVATQPDKIIEQQTIIVVAFFMMFILQFSL